MKNIFCAVLSLSIMSTVLAPIAKAYNINAESGEYTVSFAYANYTSERTLCEEEDCGRAYTWKKQSQSLKLDINESDKIEIGSLLTDLGITRGEVAGPADYSKSGGYHWQKVGSDDAVEVLTKDDFEKQNVQLEAAFNEERVAGEDLVLRLNYRGAENDEGQALPEVEDLVFKKEGFLGYVLPELHHEGWEFKGWKQIIGDAEQIVEGQINAEAFPENGFLEVVADWEGDDGMPGLVDEETGTEIAFGSPVPSGSKLTVSDMPIQETLKEEASTALKRIYDITVVKEEGEVEVKNNEMLISIPLAEELSGYKYFQVLYIVDGEVKESWPATAVDGKLLFNTSHLSVYGVQAANKPFTTEMAVASSVDSPTTEAPVWQKNEVGLSKAAMIIAFGAICVIVGVCLTLKKEHKRIIKF